MTPRQRPSTLILYFILLWCVFSFKIFLTKIGEAGFRPDDLWLLLGFVILLLRGDLVRIPRSRVFNAYLVFVFVAFCSALWNGLSGRVQLQYSMVFVARLMEYMVFYFLGYTLVESGINVMRGLKIYFCILCVVVPLQMMNLIPTASRFDSSRAIGNTNGPYELAVVASFFMCYFGYHERKRVNAGLSFVMLVLTASRITFVGAVISIGRHVAYRGKPIIKVLVAASIMLAIVIAWGGRGLISVSSDSYQSSESLADRLNGSSSLLSLDYVNTLLAAVPPYSNSQDYMRGMFAQSTYLASRAKEDTSGMTRAYRWIALIKSATADADSIVIGIGPSFASAAADGYYIRVFAETGIVGLMAFIFFLNTLRKKKGDESGAFNEYVFILVVTACFIDIFQAYKPMLLFWLWHGMNEFKARGKEDAYSLPNAY